ncbi:hypothetical protein ACFO3U_00420 [Flavobacterium ponti]|uniref:Uncharacterized protein n=1 Tax=Flavobacterium ponti TaxID=665133 RepID=A0ABV9NYL8_9FLAO
MKLNEEQIERLYQFTRQHYVEWYDLQTELVDHLANAIEEQWQQNPKLSFEEALQIEFKKFGVFGFMDVVEKRQAALNKKYNKIVWSHFKEFFSIPKIIGTASVFIILVLIMLKFEFAHIVVISLFVISTIFFFVGIIKLSIRNKKQNKISGKRWLYKDIIYGLGTFGGLSYLPIQIALQLYDKINFLNLISSVIISITVISVFLFNYIVLFIIPSKAEEYLKETYPEYEFANTL